MTPQTLECTLERSRENLQPVLEIFLLPAKKNCSKIYIKKKLQKSICRKICNETCEILLVNFVRPISCVNKSHLFRKSKT